MVVDADAKEDTHGVLDRSTFAATVLFPGALGDVCLALPTMRVLAARHDRAPIRLAVSRWLVPFVRSLELSDTIVPIDDATMARFLGGAAPPAWWDADRVVYSWFGTHDASIRQRVGAHARDVVWASVPRGPGERHAALEVAASAGWDTTWEGVVAGARVDVARRDRGGKVLLLHRGSGGVPKRWTLAGFDAVSRWWTAAGGVVEDLVGPADRELPALDGARVVQPAVEDVPVVVARADLFLGGDSGPAHVAGLVGTPGVVLYGPTRPERWRPLSDRLEPCVSTEGDATSFGRLSAADVVVLLERRRPRILDSTPGRD